MVSAVIDRRLTLTGIGALAAAHTLAGSAQAKSEPFNIFFDYGKTELSPSTKPLIDGIKSILKKNSRVTLAGCCDTSEPDSNAVGMARAVEVLKALAGSELPPGTQLTVLSTGSANLLVKTGPNVREPRNRRVAVTIA